MKRITLPDGRWFDESKARQWAEDTNWDGSNHISIATGSQWEHERLYRTASGNWVLHNWSQWQGTSPGYEIITDDAAARWLGRNGHAIPADLAEQFGELEI